jgi:GT2 family glycosyltransferase
VQKSIAVSSNEPTSKAPHVSVIVATRDRGSAIHTTLESVRASKLTEWELIVVDQSMSNDTETVVRQMADADPRVRYVRSCTQGASSARNVALRMVRAPFIAITDDDCEVAPDWLMRIVKDFEADPSVGFICSTLAPAPFDHRLGHIPHSLPPGRRIVRRPWPLTECYTASVAVRQSVLDQVGLFDEHLGTGAVFSSTEDQDICHRVLLAGHRVLIDPEARVIHHGFRTNEQMRRIWERDGRGVGGMLGKELRCGSPQALLELASFWAHWLGIVLGRIIRLRRPFKFRQTRSYVLYSALSFVQALRYPVARDWRVFTPQNWLSSNRSSLVVD